MWRATYPHCGSIFVFRSKRKDRLKMIVWDGTGMVLVTKMARSRRFHFSACSRRRGCPDATQLSVLMAGLDWTEVARKAVAETHKSLLKRLLLLAIQ